MTKKSKLIALLAPLAIILSACSGTPAAETTPDGTDSETNETTTEARSIAYLSPAGAQPGQQQIGAGIEGGATELGWESRFLDSNLSVDKQVSDFQTALQLGNDYISLWALDDDALSGVYVQADSQGTKLIGLNSESDYFSGNVSWQTHVCLDGGTADQTAEYINEIKPGAKVIVIGGPPVKAVTATVDCFVEAAKAAGLDVVNKTDNTNDDVASASNIMSDLLLKHPDVDAVWSYNDVSALGASASIMQAGGTIYDGSNDGTVVIGINADADAVEAVRQGRLTGTWDPNPAATGWGIMKAAELIEAGDSPNLVIAATFWSKENIDEYVDPENREYTLSTIPLVD